jgi:hypothetical protein
MDGTYLYNIKSSLISCTEQSRRKININVDNANRYRDKKMILNIQTIISQQREKRVALYRER